MLEWVYYLPVAWMAVVIFAGTFLVAFGILAIVNRLATRGHLGLFTGLVTAVLSPLGTIFALFGGFLAVQGWNDSQRATEAVNQEASALRTVVILASNFPAPFEHQIDALVRRQIQDASTVEWPAMASASISLASIPAPLVEALHLTLAEVAQGEGQVIAQREIVRSLHEALEARRGRILISESTIDGVKWACLTVEGILMLVAVAMVHIDKRSTAVMAMTIFATAIATSMLLIASHARPFSGAIHVGPDALLQVMPEAK
jgi:hypothetical protein